MFDCRENSFTIRNAVESFFIVLKYPPDIIVPRMLKISGTARTPIDISVESGIDTLLYSSGKKIFISFRANCHPQALRTLHI